jgi:hypothetical protein
MAISLLHMFGMSARMTEGLYPLESLEEGVIISQQEGLVPLLTLKYKTEQFLLWIIDY